MRVVYYHLIAQLEKEKAQVGAYKEAVITCTRRADIIQRQPEDLIVRMAELVGS